MQQISRDEKLYSGCYLTLQCSTLWNVEFLLIYHPDKLGDILADFHLSLWAARVLNTSVRTISLSAQLKNRQLDGGGWQNILALVCPRNHLAFLLLHFLSGVWKENQRFSHWFKGIWNMVTFFSCKILLSQQKKLALNQNWEEKAREGEIHVHVHTHAHICFSKWRGYFGLFLGWQNT